jgi:hypothetical protein
MFSFSRKLPISEEERLWVENGFRRLEKMLGRWRMLAADVVLPTSEYFPDRYDGTADTAEPLFRRVCGYMQVDRTTIELEIFADETAELRKLLPYWRGDSAGCAGLYTHESPVDGDQPNEGIVVAVRSSQLQDPLALVATFAHELGHVILLGRRLMDPRVPDHEPMTDLLTVFLGLGIFTSSSAARFQQYQDDRQAGWSIQRLGYLPEAVYGYALARFAVERGEQKPKWIKHLSTNVRVYFDRSHAWITKQPGFIATPKPIG